MPLTFNLGATAYPLVADEGGYYWYDAVPKCPKCGELLTRYCEEDTTQAATYCAWHDETYIECDNCSWRSERLEWVKNKEK